MICITNLLKHVSGPSFLKPFYLKLLLQWKLLVIWFYTDGFLEGQSADNLSLTLGKLNCLQQTSFLFIP